MFYNCTKPTAEIIKLYHSLFKAYVLAYHTKCKQLCQEELIRKLTEMKKAEDLLEEAEQLMKELTAIAIEKKESFLILFRNTHIQLQLFST